MRTTCIIVLVLASCAGVLPGCSAPPRSTRLTDNDLGDMSAELAEKLTQSDWMRGRDQASEPIIITWDKVENLTTDLLSRSEQWAMMSKLQSGAGLVNAGREKAFTVVIPATLKEEGEERGAFEKGYAAGRAPTHRMDATLRSATRADGGNRTDVYLCDFRVTELASGSVEWTDTVALKRAAVGLSFD